VIAALRARLHALARLLYEEHRAPGRVAAAIFVGAVVGTTPFFGFHILICLALSIVLRLNKVIVYAAANISIPPVAPFLGLASVELGEKILHGRFLGLARAMFHETPARVLAERFFVAWLVGGAVIGAALGFIGGAVAYAILVRRPQALLRPETPTERIATAIQQARFRYDREPGRFKWYARMKYVMDPCYRAIAAKIPPRTFTVDLGTGLGMLPVLLGILGEDRRALGVEWDAEKAEAGARAAAGLAGIEVTTGDVREFAIPTCDAITVVDVLHYYDAEAQRALLARCASALRSGGVLLVREGDGARRGGSRFTRFVERFVTRLGWNRGPAVRFRPAADLEADLRALGLAVTRDEVAGRMHPGNVLFEARRC
jgi:uncharacterized protein (DUF2062 family)/SAM-dependent methyltransferase